MPYLTCTKISCVELAHYGVSRAKDCTDTWGQLVLLTTILNHKTCINTSRQVLEKTLFAINAIFTQDTNLSKNESRGVPAENKRYMFKM